MIVTSLPDSVIFSATVEYRSISELRSGSIFHSPSMPAADAATDRHSRRSARAITGTAYLFFMVVVVSSKVRVLWSYSVL
jgi:hypothetical protein